MDETPPPEASKAALTKAAEVLALQSTFAATLPPMAFAALIKDMKAAIDAHPKFERDQNRAPRFEVTHAGWSVYCRVLRKGTLGMKRRFREIYGEGPTPELAVASLVEGLDHWAEVLRGLRTGELSPGNAHARVRARAHGVRVKRKTEKLDEYIARLRADLEGARAALGREVLKSERLERERDDARANARLLAHSCENDGIPGIAFQRAVKDSLAYPAVPEKHQRKSAWERPAPVIERKGTPQ